MGQLGVNHFVGCQNVLGNYSSVISNFSDARGNLIASVTTEKCFQIHAPAKLVNSNKFLLSPVDPSLAIG